MKKHGFTCLFVTIILSLFVLCSCAAPSELKSDTAKNNVVTGTETSSGDVDSSRKIVKDAWLDVETKGFDNFLTTLNDTVKTLGGYTQSSNVSGNSYSNSSMRKAKIIARVPAESLDDFIAAIKNAGNVTEETTSVTDVTMSYIDIESRLDALNTEEQSLLSLLEKADNMDDIITVQSRLTEVRSEIENYESKKRVLDNNIGYSTVTLNIDEVEHETATEKTSIWVKIKNNVTDGFKNVWMFLKGLFVFVISAIPYLLIPGLVTAVVLIIVGKKDKKKKNGGNGYGTYPPRQQ